MLPWSSRGLELALAAAFDLVPVGNSLESCKHEVEKYDSSCLHARDLSPRSAAPSGFLHTELQP